MNLRAVPPHIGRMAHLEELRLGSNPIHQLPDWIGNLRALRVLRLDKTGLQSLPFGLADCASLQMLDLDDVILLSPPKQILSKGVSIVKEWLGRLREARGGGRLDLSSLGLEDWPPELVMNTKEGQYASLKRLNLLDNILTEMSNVGVVKMCLLKFLLQPVEVCDLTTLVELMAGYNRMLSIHSKICEMKILKGFMFLSTTSQSFRIQSRSFSNKEELLLLLMMLCDGSFSPSFQSLRFVNLDGNNFREIPACLCVITELRDLRMNQNQIAGLPPALARLGKLEELELSYNEISVLPRAIGQNTSLRRLKLSYNMLDTVPPDVGALTKLEELHLTHNQLAVLPAELGKLLPPKGSLKNLVVTANFFKAPLSSIITRGCAATLRYLGEQL
ncbi:hypothetical protein GUITHDRAFT_101875 [Guillardia theta CCMP2712]|uniref:Disease resistance R13L4/SHOC-2-like LRR domain-containing protein n=1 Tax=Guillardia theta (strain CCMP2712) TaxID=905079 RepID=L1JX96_GUITC|nr:hypothetical protein GUITHDRAFT_101875 [Guillardia theta CCMP2712]EKX52723.1 hypothetical protein GUITHDRAFT_101875 [Guillardia theta CCMP2712]|eukprot:XP_005839703.1 hypothetical protein GUITHDRAFT_101875 [Guillardia theta CCMP2712]